MKNYNWDYPPTDPDAYAEEKMQFDSEISILGMWPEDVASSIVVQYIENPEILYNVARRASNTYHRLIGERAMERFQLAMNQMVASHNRPPISWDRS